MADQLSEVIRTTHGVLYEGQDNQVTVEKLYSLMLGMDGRLSTIEKNVTNIDKISKSIDSLVTGFKDLKIKVQTIETSVDKLNKTTNKHDHEITVVKTNQLKTDRETKDLKSNIDTQSQSLQGISDIFDDFKKTHASHIDEVKDVRKTISKTVDDLNDHVDEIKQEMKSALSDAQEHAEELQDTVLDLQCRSMKYNLIFTGHTEHYDEDTEYIIRSFLKNELRIKYHISLGNVHRFGHGAPPGRGRKGRPRPIIARFIYMKDLEAVLSNGYRLKGTMFGINRQFPEPIEQARRSLYKIAKQKRAEGFRVKLERDVLLVNGKVYNEIEDDTADTILKTFSEAVRTPSTPANRARTGVKRRRMSSTPRRDR